MILNYEITALDENGCEHVFKENMIIRLDHMERFEHPVVKITGIKRGSKSIMVWGSLYEDRHSYNKNSCIGSCAFSIDSIHTNRQSFIVLGNHNGHNS